MPEAVRCYEAAVEAAERDGERGVLAESLRRLGVVHHRRDLPGEGSGVVPAEL